MKLLIVAVLFLSSCAHFRWDSDWEFDCDWARTYDSMNQMRARTSGFPSYSNFTAMYCGEPDPTAPWNLKRKKKELPDEVPPSQSPTIRW